MEGFEIVLGARRADRIATTAGRPSESADAASPARPRLRLVGDLTRDGREERGARGTRGPRDLRALASAAAPNGGTTVRVARSSTAGHAAQGHGVGRAGREAIDILVGGVNVTARVDPDQAPCVLRDFAVAVVDLACGLRRRATVRFYDAPWELGLERIEALVDAAGAPGAQGLPGTPPLLPIPPTQPPHPVLSMSVVRNGPDAEVAVFDRRIPFADVIEGTRAALDALLVGARPGGSGLDAPSTLGAAPDAPSLAEVLVDELVVVRGALDRLTLPPPQGSPHVGGASSLPCDEILAVVEAEPALRVAFGGEILLRVDPQPVDSRGGTEISDLHSLLGRGRLRAVVRGRTKELGEVHTFLVGERLVEVARQVLDAWERGRALHVRVDIAGPLVGIRLEADGALSMSLVPAPGEPARAPAVFPSLEGPDFIDAAVAFGRILVRTIVRRDRRQASNLRLMQLRRRVRELSDRLRDVARPVGPFGESDLVNPRRESYRPYVQGPRPAAPTRAPDKREERNERGERGERGERAERPCVPRLRYEPRWAAEVPGLDLRATFLCGDRLILSGSAQTTCVDRADGRPLWEVPTVRATSLPTQGGLARLRSDGRLELRDFGNGEVVWSQPCAPRSRGTPAACTIVAPGLPRLLVATDGDRHLVAFDLTSGEPRWRYALARPGPIRIRRAGRLLVVSSDEAQLVALDALDGEVVWRVRDRLRFAVPAAIEREDLVAIAGEPSGLARLHFIDALSGARRYERPLEAAVATDTAPMLAGPAILVVTRDRRGLGLVALDRTSGVERWSAAPGTWPIGTCALALDDFVVMNLPTGEVVALHATTGETVWRHVFDAPFRGDAPRRLEPVLRAGALFVPQDKVRVMRPLDGAIVGVVGPSDLVPDLLRVDERCDVYVAEESGHIAAFGASARLELVRS